MFQVETAISAGMNQQSNSRAPLKIVAACAACAACRRHSAKKESAPTERKSACSWSSGTLYQGGKGTIEGAGSADDEVAVKNKTLEREAKKQVQALQTKVQSALGLSAPGVNA